MFKRVVVGLLWFIVSSVPTCAAEAELAVNEVVLRRVNRAMLLQRERS